MINFLFICNHLPAAAYLGQDNAQSRETLIICSVCQDNNLRHLYI